MTTMAVQYRGTSASQSLGRPLLEVHNQTNIQPPSRRSGTATTTKHGRTNSSSHPSLPHNESLEPNGTLAVRSGESVDSPAHKRVSRITAEERDSRRNSAISSASTAASKRKTFIGHWQLGKTIGRGGCSRVRVVRHRYREQFGAVKIITRSVAESTRAQSLANLIKSNEGVDPATSSRGYKPIPYGLEREICVMKLLEHPNIVRLFDVWENRNELYLIMEYVDGGELFHYVDERKSLPEDETVYIFRQIVSALLYCHRLLICHRDLKPENILLNQRDLTVKLIDFGMAALQPEGRLLSTPCGSPHYAAPEVVSSKPYDGTQADVWSCGVILYVMLTGTTPYNYGENADIRDLFEDIRKAKYFMPRQLSMQAKDLIRRIFVVDPKKRITMDGIWEHPLLHKYDEEFAFDGPAGTKEAAVGRLPKLEHWKVSRIQDIDREILRNMRTLWHSESEQSLVKKLLNNDINQEKLFYAALVKHREENLESLVGDADHVSYSASDYHHSRSAGPGDPPPPVPPRSRSQYSIMNDEHLRPSSSFVTPPPSLSSYDPYRASKDPLVNTRGGYLSVTVHRNGTTSTKQTSGPGNGLRQPIATRTEQHKQQYPSIHSRSSNRSAASLQRSRRSRPSMQRSSTSRHSLSSSLVPSSPPIIATMRPSDVHRRGVSFGHIRAISTTSALTTNLSGSSSTPKTPALPSHLSKRSQRSAAHGKGDLASSPLAHIDQPVQSRKGRATKLETPRIKIRRPETPHQHIRSEIRKHSAELEKACEEAFFRDSFGSGRSPRTSLTDQQSPYETPPSSVSAAPVTTPDMPAAKTISRPQPTLPKDTPNTYLTRTLEETRSKLAAYKNSGDENSAKFDEVMKLLDTIMPEASAAKHRRVVTAPEGAKTQDSIEALPMISEEIGDFRSSRDGFHANWQRSVTDPLTTSRRPDDRTIRVVPPSPSGTIAPLNVRKRVNVSDAASSSASRPPTVKASVDTPSGKHSNIDSSGLQSINEDSVLTATPTMVRKKRSGWFTRIKKETEPEAETALAATPTNGDSRAARSLGKPVTPLVPERPDSAQSSEFPIRDRRATGTKKSGLAQWIARKGKNKGIDASITEGDTTLLTSNPSAASLFSRSTSAPFTAPFAALEYSDESDDDSPPDPSASEAAGPSRSWFARFFRIKPAVHVICLRLPRGRARTELALLLHAWQRHGVRDVRVDRARNTLGARVDRRNALRLRPVAFRVELFVVLDRGRRAGLSLARCVQVRGPASAFRKVVEVVNGVCRHRGWLVEDEEQCRALREILVA